VILLLVVYTLVLRPVVHFSYYRSSSG
jgi:hypothetical protein